jgi:hypothetical protein
MLPVAKGYFCSLFEHFLFLNADSQVPAMMGAALRYGTAGGSAEIGRRISEELKAGWGRSLQKA